jgi:hypothetical protein
MLDTPDAELNRVHRKGINAVSLCVESSRGGEYPVGVDSIRRQGEYAPLHVPEVAPCDDPRSLVLLPDSLSATALTHDLNFDTEAIEAGHFEAKTMSAKRAFKLTDILTLGQQVLDVRFAHLATFIIAR